MLHRKKYYVISICVFFIMILVLSTYFAYNHSPEKKDQYAILNDYEKNKVITVRPSQKNYEKIVEQFTLSSVNSKGISIPNSASIIKKITFYQKETRKLIDFGKKMEMKPMIEVNIYKDKNTQYVESHLSSMKKSGLSYKMPEALRDLVDGLE